ncbi:MAG: type II secretion system F family protein, partial [Planctomycetaceae bacterium]|nr:type II secretion system F family protein [Planctomycetaceae bacterium]
EPLMVYAIGGLVLLGGIACVVYAFRQTQVRQLSLDRLRERSDPTDESDKLSSQEFVPKVFARRHYVWPWISAGLVFAVLWWLVSIPVLFAGALSIIVGLMAMQADAVWLAWRQDRIENQLADAIDLMVAAVKVGSSIQNALEYAARDARKPLQIQLEEVVGRIRYGDDPKDVMEQLTEQVPLETFRLFSTTLSVNWEVGGSLVRPLANVGRTIRDRIELTRRLRAMTTQSRLSVVAVILVTYFIGLLMWRNDPERMAGFLQSGVGQGLVATAMLLQGVGIVWISRISKVKF